MSQSTKIEWTEVTWNPIAGCSKVSAGCYGCYAIRLANRLGANPQTPQYKGLTKIVNGRPNWTGEVRFIEERLEDPLRWKKPRRIFVNSMSDLFHENIPDTVIADIFGVMARCPQHVFQILTKRADRMKLWMANGAGWMTLAVDMQKAAIPGMLMPWPLPNVWLGVSVEDQKTADERIPLLLQAPATVRWVSAEPLLGPVNLSFWIVEADGLSGRCGVLHDVQRTIKWVVIGGESGPGARPMSLRWVRSIVKQCQERCVPVFVKQLGARPGTPSCADFDCTLPDCGTDWLKLHDRKGGDPSEWPKDLRVREYPDV